jgi:hypothetical protein
MKHMGRNHEQWVIEPKAADAIQGKEIPKSLVILHPVFCQLEPD